MKKAFLYLSISVITISSLVSCATREEVEKLNKEKKILEHKIAELKQTEKNLLLSIESKNLQTQGKTPEYIVGLRISVQKAFSLKPGVTVELEIPASKAFFDSVKEGEEINTRTSTFFTLHTGSCYVTKKRIVAL